LEDAKGLLRQREQQLADMSNVLAEMEAQNTSTREQAQNGRARAIQAVEEAKKVASAAKRRMTEAEAARDEWKEKATRAKQESRDMEQELHKAQEAWRERIKKAEQKAQDLEKELKEAAAHSAAELKDVVAKFKMRLRAQATGSEETRGELEATRAKAEEEQKRLSDRIRLSSDTELQLRRELQMGESSRQELQERVSELSGQLERAQAAYSEAAREVGEMTMRLNELEFGEKSTSSSEALLRDELQAAKERTADLEQRLNECTWMRDHALKSADEARAQLQNLEEEARLRAFETREAAGTEAEARTAPNSPAASAGGKATVEEAAEAQQEVLALQQQLQKLGEQHAVELQSQVEMSKEEIAYLKRKNDEKDRRLEILTCERNALRFESTEAQEKPKPAKPSHDGEKLVDLEDGLSLLSQDQGSSGAIKAFFADGDLVLRRFSKLLFASPTTRRLFYGYVLLLHIWIWVVLHRAAAVHATHTSSKALTANAGFSVSQQDLVA